MPYTEEGLFLLHHSFEWMFPENSSDCLWGDWVGDNCIDVFGDLSSLAALPVAISDKLACWSLEESLGGLSEGSRHKLLKCWWGITVTHLYDIALECAEYCGECGFIHIFRLNASLLISLSHVQFGPESSLCNVMAISILLGEGCHILLGVIILLSQIKYSAQCRVHICIKPSIQV